MPLDYDTLETVPEESLDAILDAATDAPDGAAVLVLMLMAMRDLRVDGVTVDGILTRMAALANEYVATQ